MKDLSEDEENDLDSNQSEDEIDSNDNKSDNDLDNNLINNNIESNKIENLIKPKKKSKNVADFDEYHIDSSDEEVIQLIRLKVYLKLKFL